MVLDMKIVWNCRGRLSCPLYSIKVELAGRRLDTKGSRYLVGILLLILTIILISSSIDLIESSLLFLVSLKSPTHSLISDHFTSYLISPHSYTAKMPSLSKLILLSTLLLSGALSMPIASPGDGWHPSASTGSLGLHRTGKREAQPAGASDGGEGHHKRDVEELEARGDGWHPSASTGNLGLTRSGKREADPEARNTLETIPIAPAEFAKRGPSGAHGGGSGHHKREAEEAELDARGDGWHPSASTGNLGLTRSGKREAEEADLVARGDGWHPSANTGNLGLTRTGKRDAEEAELEARGDGWHPSANTGNLGLTRSGKRDSEEADLEARGDGWHPSASTGNLGLTRSGKREEAGEPFEIVAEEAVEKREAAPSGAHGGGSGHHKREAEEAEIEARGDGWHPSASTGNLGLTKSG